MADRTLTAADKHVALTLALHMDLDGGSARPGMRRLAHEASRKTGTVAASIRRLERRGYLEVARDPSFGIRKDVNRYQAKCAEGNTSTSGQVCPSGSAKCAEGHTKLLRSYGGGARKSAPAAVCSECHTGGGEHVDGCPVAGRAAA